MGEHSWDLCRVPGFHSQHCERSHLTLPGWACSEKGQVSEHGRVTSPLAPHIVTLPGTWCWALSPNPSALYCLSGHSLNSCLFLQKASWTVLLSPKSLAMCTQPLRSPITNNQHSEMCVWLQNQPPSSPTNLGVPRSRSPNPPSLHWSSSEALGQSARMVGEPETSGVPPRLKKEALVLLSPTDD